MFGQMCNKQAFVSSSINHSLSCFLFLMLFRVEKPNWHKQEVENWDKNWSGLLTSGDWQSGLSSSASSIFFSNQQKSFILDFSRIQNSKYWPNKIHFVDIVYNKEERKEKSKLKKMKNEIKLSQSGCI